MTELADVPEVRAAPVSALTRAPHERRDFAYELKFLVPDAVATEVLAWGRRHLPPDPHAELHADDRYRVTSLYFDTPQLDVFRGVGSNGRCKYRVRRYGAETALFLERKLKTRGLVGKRRTRIAAEALSHLAQPQPQPHWDGHWYLRRLRVRGLIPRMLISYERTARVGIGPAGPLRLTLDRELRCLAADGLAWNDCATGRPLLTGETILELKFRDRMPALFKQLIQQFALAAQPVSKYRLAVVACGLAAPLVKPVSAKTKSSPEKPAHA